MYIAACMIMNELLKPISVVIDVGKRSCKRCLYVSYVYDIMLVHLANIEVTLIMN